MDAKARFDTLKEWTYEHRRPLMCAFAALAVIVLLVGLSLTWFVENRALSTIGKVEGPIMLKIKGPNQTAMEQMDLTYDADKDTISDDGTVTRLRAFCVESQGKGFELQIANTTNITGLTINVYRATDVTSAPGESPDVVGRDGLTQYYAWKKNGGSINGFQTINEDGTSGIATSDKSAENYAASTFGEYGNVQKNARPLYRWKRIDGSDLDDTSATGATKYIIECTWPKAANTKETDVIYIIARN